jgi:hypothetical protein
MERKTIINTLLVFFFGLFFALPTQALAATLSFSPVSGTVEVGDSITVRVMVSSSTPINAISGVVSIPTSLFSIESVSKTGSLLNFWVSEPNFSRGAGTLSFEGVALGGFSGGTGSVVTVVLRALKTGSGVLSFTSGQVLANDGQGTDVTSGLNKAVFSIEPKKVITPEPVVREEEEVIEAEEEPAPEGVEETLSQELSLQAPEIVLSRRIRENIILGSSEYPQAQVLLTFLSETGVKVFVMGDTDSNGDFAFWIPSTLKSGPYKISAVVIQKDLTYSPPSNIIETHIGSIFSDVGIEIKIAVLILLLILIFLFIRMFIANIKALNAREYVNEETEEAKEILHKSFNVLSADVKRSIKKGVGDKEALKDLKEDLEDAEELISKEIEDIRKVK